MGRKIRPGQLDLTTFDEDFLSKSEIVKNHSNLHCRRAQSIDNSKWGAIGNITIFPSDSIACIPGNYYKLMYPVTKINMAGLSIAKDPSDISAMAGFALEMEFGSESEYLFIPPRYDGSAPLFISSSPEITSPWAFPTLTGGGVFVYHFFPMAAQWAYTINRVITE